MKLSYCGSEKSIFNDLESKEGSFKGEIFSHLWFRIKVKQRLKFDFQV